MCMCVFVCIQYSFCSYKHFTVCRVYLGTCALLCSAQHPFLVCSNLPMLHKKRRQERPTSAQREKKIALLLRSDESKGVEEKKRGEKSGEKREKRHCSSQSPDRANVLVLLARCCLKKRGLSHCLGRPKYMHTCWSTKPVLAILVSTCPLVVF